MKLTKWQQEIIKLEQKADRNVNRQLWSIYNDVLKDVRKSLKKYIDHYETLPEYRKAELLGLTQLEDEIVELLNSAYPTAKLVVTDFKEKSAIQGYYSTFWQVERETGVSLSFNHLDKRLVREMVKEPITGKTLSQRMYKQRNKLANQAQKSISNGLVQGKSYVQIAKEIESATEATYKQALRITRTESGRLRSLAKEQAMNEAEAVGVEFEKMWVSTLDNRTRGTHRNLDGQIRKKEEKFKSSSGYEATAPKLFGVAREDINCRCTFVLVVYGIRPSHRRAGKEVMEYMNYQQWWKKHGESRYGKKGV